MDKIFDWDSPIVQFAEKIADLFLLNMLVFLTSIPIVTIGGAQTAMYDVLGRMTRKESYRIWKDYWYAFRRNWKQATVLWLLFSAGGLLLGFSLWFYLVRGSQVSEIMVILVGIVCLFWLGAAVWAFPLLSRFDNTIKNTFRNAVYCAIFQFPKTVIAVACKTLPWVLLVTQFPWFVRLGLFWVCLWGAMAGYISMLLFKKSFSIMEEMTEMSEL